MVGEIEEPLRFNFQTDLLHSGSISFGRFESESLSWERRSIFSHNRHLEDVEKYSKPGSVNEMKAYFEAEFRRKALLKQNSSGSQDEKEFQTIENNDTHDLHEPDNSPHSSGHYNYDQETEIQKHVNGSFETLCSDNGNASNNVDHKLKETDQIRTENIILVKSEDNIRKIANSGNQQTISSNVRSASGMKQLKPKLTGHTSSEASNGSNKGLIMKEKEKKSIRPASPVPHSVRKTSKSQESSKSFLTAKTVEIKSSVVEKCLPGARQTINRTKNTVITPRKPLVNQSTTCFTFKSDQRAEKRKEEKRAADMAQSGKSLNFKATPMPSFYKTSSRYSDQNKVVTITTNKIPNRPRTATMSPHTNKHSSNPRPSSSTSLTNKNRPLQPPKRVHEKKNDSISQKQKEAEPTKGPRARTTLRGNGPT